MNSCEAAEQVSNEKKGSRLKTPKKVSKESSHSTEGGSSSEEESDEVKPVKKNVTKGRISNSNETKKRKRSTKEIVSAKKQRKHVQHTSEEDSDEEGGENVSEDGHSESSNEKPVKVRFIFLLPYLMVNKLTLGDFFKPHRKKFQLLSMASVWST